jgi:BioD-like phosphotransacetylase family protein
MSTLYLVSVEGEVGKTALALGLALRAQERGLKVGYTKPVGVRVASASGHLVEADATFAKQALGLEDSVDVISPVLLTEVIRREAIEGRVLDAAATIKTAFAQLARGKDLMIVEGPPTTRQGITLGVEPSKVAELLDAQVLVVLRGEYQLSAEAALLAQTIFGKRLIGAILNAAPIETVEDARTHFAPYLERHGLQLFGVLPRDPVLGAFTVGELVSLLRGRLLCCPEAEGTLVESFIVGAMGAEAALRYFLQQANKAVITGGDRTDIILAALDTPTRCIILTGNLMPDQVAITKAVDRRVPILLSPLDTFEAVRRVEEARGPVRLASQQQVERLRQIIRREVDMDALLKRLDQPN